MSSRALLPVALLLVAAGCAHAPVVVKHSYDFRTTALFKLPCDQVRKPDAPVDPLEIELVECNSTRMVRMVENFLRIQESDADRGIEGDTLTDVRAKGFTIYTDATERRRRPNTRPLYGNDALAAAGMGVSPPPLQTPADVRAYTDFMGQHYAEEYYERDLRSVTDRFCINSRDSRDMGDDRTFVIVWRNGHVYKRVIKGGPIDNPKQEKGFLICPSTFIVDTVTGGLSTAARGMAGVK
ncbi:MAG TPA: hypothetical protein VFL90_01075 [Methylomirabilota bacterium]|nr:hypothetical protein [Methylomirabilota bacterium]